MSTVINGAGVPLAELMQTLLQAVNQQIDLGVKTIAANVEDRIAADKMEIAQSIINTYA